MGTTDEAGTMSSAAYAPGARYAITSSPIRIGPAGPVASAPTAVTTPAASAPSRIGRFAGSVPKAPLYILWSKGLTPTARTSMRT